MAAFDRARLLIEISRVMRRLTIEQCNQLMLDCGIQQVPRVGAYYDAYLPRRLTAASSHQIALLHSIVMRNVEFGKPLTPAQGMANPSQRLRFYICHGDFLHDIAIELAESLALAGIDCVAILDSQIDENDYSPQNIEKGLLQADALIALCGASAISGVIHQQIGFALGAGKPIFNLLHGGFSEGIAAHRPSLNWARGEGGKDVALRLIELMLHEHELSAKLTDQIVTQIVHCDSQTHSYQIIGFCRRALAFSTDLTAGQLYELRRAARENEEIQRFASGRGPELIESLCNEAEQSFFMTG
ncbi:MAG: hypothetical protein DHS20C08_23460 [Rhodomicrobium sp.]|nr:MAG: hypothetical protein DHS20C08_23460 [Rhodomicrobium sp.]